MSTTTTAEQTQRLEAKRLFWLKADEAVIADPVASSWRSWAESGNAHGDPEPASPSAEGMDLIVIADHAFNDFNGTFCFLVSRGVIPSDYYTEEG